MAVVTEKELQDENTFRELKESMDEILLFDDVVSAEKAMVNLDAFFDEYKNFRNVSPQYYARYQEILTLAKWASLPALNDEKAVRLFGESLPAILYREEYDILNKLDILLIKQTTLERRDEIRGKLRKAMIESEAVLTESGIHAANGLASGTVGGWIHDYNAYVGASTKQIDTMKRTSYFVQSATFPKLPEREKAAVRLLLDVYEYLKLSSGDLRGFEQQVPVDDEGRQGWVYRGQFEPIDKNTVGEYRALMRSIQTAVQQGAAPARGEPATAEQEKNIRKEITNVQQKYQQLLTDVHTEEQQLAKDADGKTDLLLNTLFDKNLKATPMQKVGALLAFSRMAALDELFRDARTALYIEQNILPRIAEKNIPLDALRKDFVRQTFSAVYRKEALKGLLMDALGKEEDAAMLYQQIVNLAGGKNQQELLSGSFYDLSQHRYRFQESAWEDGTLVKA